MKVLVACEESQIVCAVFREMGHEAYSCDLQECSGNHPEWHIKDDVLNHLEDGWDLMIAHPPCTYLSRAGTRWLFPKGELNQNRYALGIEAKEFFLKLLNAKIPKICVENPVPHKIFDMPKPSQIIQPFYFGHDVQKTTYLWLKGLPKLRSTNSLEKQVSPKFMRDRKGVRHSKWFMDCGFNAGKEKSKTFSGIARAMANQWGSLK